jgi:GNAT superfamily N-acetyltransferase
LIPDYFDFFDHRAFTDNPPWEGCYCIGWQLTQEAEQRELVDKAEEYGGGRENKLRALREEVVRQIESGALKGYLAYVDGIAIGWVNANARETFIENAINGTNLHAPAEKRETAVVCFEIAPELRGQGVATALLARVIEDARAEGRSAVVGFAVAHGARNPWDFTGPMRLYQRLGFVKDKDEGELVVMRKAL